MSSRRAALDGKLFFLNFCFHRIDLFHHPTTYPTTLEAKARTKSNTNLTSAEASEIVKPPVFPRLLFVTPLLLLPTMAFLLRNSKKSTSGNGRTRQDSGATADTRILPRPRSTLNRRNQSQQLLQRQSKQALFSGSQILVQRSRQQLQKQQNAPTNNQQQVDIQSQLNLTAKKQREAQQQQQQQQQQETPGVISMSEGKRNL